MVGQVMPCQAFIKNEWVQAQFIGVYQFSDVLEPSPVIGGHNGGVISYPIAVVRVNDELKEIKLSKVKFS